LSALEDGKMLFATRAVAFDPERLNIWIFFFFFFSTLPWYLLLDVKFAWPFKVAQAWRVTGGKGPFIWHRT
jgi:hypothetical protein